MKFSIARLGFPIVLGLGLTLAVLALAASQLPVAGAAGPWFVDPAGSDSNTCLGAGAGAACQTIGGAAGKASSGDTINIAAGTYTENVSISGKVLTFQGAGSASTIVDGGSVDRVFDTDQDVTLAGLTLQNGNATGGDGGGVHTTQAVSMTDVNVLNSTAAFNGGAVYANGPSQITNGLFQNNSGANGGAVYISNTLTLFGANFVNNTTPGWGGGARALLAFTVTGGLFQGNSADSGGGLYADAPITISGTQFLSNTVVNFGGGAHFNAAATLVNAVFSGNTASTGGGGNFNALANLTGGTFTSNTVSTKGGGAYFNAAAALTDTDFIGNVDTSTVNSGGGAGFGAAASLNGGRFLSNTAHFAGGGAYFGQPATISATLFTSNTTFQRGGGAYFNDTADVTSAQFDHNQAPTDRGAGAYFRGSAALTTTVFYSNVAASRGAGAYFFAPVTIYGTVFASNLAGVHGGGAYFNDAFDLFDIVFDRNLAQTGNGGGLFQNGVADGRIVNAIFTRDHSGAGGEDAFLTSLGSTVVLNSTLANAVGSPSAGAAIFVNSGTVGVTNTIFANYAGGLIITAGVTLNADYNLFFNAPTNAITGSHSLTGTDPLLVNPSIGDFSLGAGSPAAGAGVNAGVATDITGAPRGNPPSIGAFELPTYSLTTTTAGLGTGTVTRVPSTTVYAQGTVVTLTASANPGSTFAGWSGDVSGFTNPITLTMDSSKSVTATFNLVPPLAADLKISLLGAPSTSAPARTLTYTLMVTNTGPGLASTLRLTDTLSAGSTYQSLSAPIGWSCLTPAVGVSGQIVCTTASLALNAPAVFTVTVRLNDGLPPSSVITSIATVTSATADPSLPNTASTTTTIFAYRYYWPLLMR